MTDATTTTPDVEPAAEPTPETEQATPVESFADRAHRLFSEPAPSDDLPVIITPQMVHDSDVALAEYSEANDRAALSRFYARQAQEWGAEVAREQAARLAS